MSEYLLIAALFAVFGLFEYARPAEAGQGWRGRLRNMAYMVIVLSIGTFLATMAFRFLPSAPRQLAYEGPLTSAARAFAIIFIIDFLYYWYHRLQHKVHALWMIHELHHSEGEMNIFTSYRTYWLEYPIQAVVITAPAFYLVGLETAALAIVVTVSTLFLMSSHSNIRLSLGPLTPVLVGPQLQRIHHSRLLEHRDQNFAQVFPIFDILFGTYYRPAPDEYPPTGTDELASDAHVLDTTTRPFERWWAMLTQR